jgi:hypothetical protein
MVLNSTSPRAYFMVRWQAYGFGHVIEGQDVADAVAQGDKLEAL